MIVRIRILRHGKVAHEWSVFIVDELESLDEIFRKIKNGKLMYGRKIERIFIQEFVVDESKDSKILLTVYVKENQSCTCPVEKPYYSCDFLKPVCYYCGKGKNLVISEQYFPKCTSVKCKLNKV